MISEELATFAASGKPNEGALAMMRLSMFDWAVCGYAGRDEPVSRIVREMALAEGGTGQSTLFGVTERLPARAAALVNGTTSHALDYDDTHFGHIGHPSVVVISAALAVAEREGQQAGDFLDACVIGAEVSIRVGRWLGRSHYDAGFHQTSTAGAFGAAAAAGRIMGLNVAQIRHAFGIAAARAAGLKSQFGTMGKPYAAGMAAATGVEAATLAAAGFVSRPDALECDFGFGATHAGTARASALMDLGEVWQFDYVTHKFHACCHGTHAMIEALDSQSRRMAGKEVDSVTVSVHPSWMSVCNLPEPRTGLEAKFSLKLIAAMVMDGQDTAQLDTFSDAACVNPRLVALRDRVTVSEDDSLGVTAGHVAIKMADGRKLQGVHDLKTPMALPDRATKLRGKARSMLGDPVFGPMWEAITTRDKPELDSFARCIAGVFPTPMAATA